MRHWRAHPSCVLAGVLGTLLVSAVSGRADATDGDPFAFLSPWILISASDRQRLDRDEVVVQVLPARDGEVGALVATRLNAPPEALARWTRSILDLKRSSYVKAIGRISDPPMLADFERVVLDESDVDALRACAPGDCRMRMSNAEITSLQPVIGHGGPDWREAAQRRFRQLLLDRVNAYRATGVQGLATFNHRRGVARPADVFAALLEHSPYLRRALPQAADWLEHYPRDANPDIDSFFYWSKEHYGAGRTVISVTHVGIMQPAPDPRGPAVLVASKQLFATHYLDGGVGLTMVVRDARKDAQYLVYINRSRIDVLRGVFGGIIRSVLERRVKRDAPAIIRALRVRLESGQPTARRGQCDGFTVPPSRHRRLASGPSS